MVPPSEYMDTLTDDERQQITEAFRAVEELRSKIGDIFNDVILCMAYDRAMQIVHSALEPADTVEPDPVWTRHEREGHA